MRKSDKPTAVATFTDATGVTGSQTQVIVSNDFNQLVAMLTSSAFSGSAPTLDVVLQTSADGGTTFYDLVHFDQMNGTVTNTNAYFARFADLKSSSLYIGQGAKSGSLAAGHVSGLPLLSNTLKCIFTYGGTISATPSVTLQILQADQDYR